MDKAVAENKLRKLFEAKEVAEDLIDYRSPHFPNPDESSLGYFSEAASILNEADEIIKEFNEKTNQVISKVLEMQARIDLWEAEFDGATEGEIFIMRKRLESSRAWRKMKK